MINAHIISLPAWHGNYGCVLQAYALTRVVSEKGFEAFHLADVQAASRKDDLAFLLKNIAKIMLGRSDKVHALSKREERELRSAPADFAYSHLDISSPEDLAAEVARGESPLVIFGSDQVWRPQYTKDVLFNFGQALENDSIRRTSYAASFGIGSLDEFSASDLAKVKNLLSKFSGVSVREDSGVDLLESLGVSSVQHVDPTMLLKAEDYLQLTASAPAPAVPSAFAYILDQTQEILEESERFAASSGVPLVHFMAKETRGKILKRAVVKQRPVEEWIKGIANSPLVITDSFHGCVFSIIFNTPFIAIVNGGRGATRFESLLKVFGLEDRAVRSASDLKEIDPSRSAIDWDRVNGVLAQERMHGLSYLDSFLNYQVER